MAERQQVFISCEHGGNQVPPAYQVLFAGQEELLRSHRGYDPGALALAKLLAKELGAPLEKSETTRLLVDLNRSPNSPNLFSELVAELSRDEKELLLERHYHPYRKAVAAKIGKLIAAGVQVVHLSVHSFTPVLAGQERDADLGLLYDPDRQHEKLFCQAWRQLLKQKLPLLRVRSNYPYRGTADGLVRGLREDFCHDDYLGIELEVNQALLGGQKVFPADLQSGLLDSLQELFVTD